MLKIMNKYIYTLDGLHIDHIHFTSLLEVFVLRNPQPVLETYYLQAECSELRPIPLEPSPELYESI